MWIAPYPNQWRSKTTYLSIFDVLRWLQNLMATLVANIFVTKRAIHNREMALKTTKVPYVVPKFHELWTTNARKKTRDFNLLILCKFCTLLHCQSLYAEVSKQNSTNPCDLLRIEPNLQTQVHNWGSASITNWEPKTGYCLDIFVTTLLLNRQ